MTEFGIDISHHNRIQDWGAVRGNNITFCSMKLTESTGFTDDQADNHVVAARRVGITCGGYHFARPGSIGAQVQHFADRCDALGLLSDDSLLPMLDMEAAELRSTAADFTADFISRFRATTGVRGMLVYANLDWFDNAMRPDEWADENVYLWIARFNGKPGNPGYAHPRLALHQHTDRGRVPGILPGLIDRDVTMSGFALGDLLVGTAGAAQPRPVIPEQRESVSELASTHVVRSGENLTRIAKKHGTTVDVLVALNHIADPDVIFAGQVLQLPTAMIPA